MLWQKCGLIGAGRMDIINPDEFFAHFPRLPKTIKPKSQSTPIYNCIAFALGFENKPWWPAAGTDAYWPAGCPQEVTVSAFAAAFATLGYEPCSYGHLESSYEKIALFTDENEPTHAARQLQSGIWVSKCGSNVDIEHKLKELEGPLYGKVTMFFYRHRRSS